METYFRLKVFFGFVVPVCILAVLLLIWIGLSIVIKVSEKKRKWREKRKHGEVRKEDDAV